MGEFSQGQRLKRVWALIGQKTWHFAQWASEAHQQADLQQSVMGWVVG